MSKTWLKEAFDTLPEGLNEYIDTPIPTMQAGIWPIEDVDTAILMQGILAFNLNTILKAFEGLNPIKVFMHLAQHNEVLQLLGGTAVQYLGIPEIVNAYPLMIPGEIIQDDILYGPGTYNAGIVYDPETLMSTITFDTFEQDPSTPENCWYLTVKSIKYLVYKP